MDTFVLSSSPLLIKGLSSLSGLLLPDNASRTPAKASTPTEVHMIEGQQSVDKEAAACIPILAGSD